MRTLRSCLLQCPPWAAVVGSILMGGLAPASAECDWLVLRDGSRVETRGGWEELSRRIVFTSADGVLSSLKTDQVDLAASRRATEEAARPKPPKKAPEVAAPRRATRRWTNEDIPRGRPDPEAPAGGEPQRDVADGELDDDQQKDEDGDEEAEEQASSPVVVDGWEPEESFDGVVLVGRLRNASTNVVSAAVRLDVVLFDREGLRLVENTAAVTPTTLAAGASGEFRVEFPGIYDYGFVRFDIESTDLGRSEGAPPRTLGPAAGEVGDDADTSP